MPIKPATEQNPRSVGRTLSGASTAFGPGAQISLNMERRLFLAIPGTSVFLNENNPTTILPYDLEEGTLAAIQAALKLGDVVLGPHPVPRAARRSLMEPVYQELDNAASVEDFKPTVLQIVSGRKRMDGHPAADTIRRLCMHEAVNGCRPEFLTYFGTLLERIPGPSAVEDHPQDRHVVRVHTDSGAQRLTRTEEQSKAVKDLI